LTEYIVVSLGWVAWDLVKGPRGVADRADVFDLRLDLFISNCHAVANVDEASHAVETEMSKSSVFCPDWVVKIDCGSCCG
jgi:hypothetical protein